MAPMHSFLCTPTYNPKKQLWMRAPVSSIPPSAGKTSAKLKQSHMEMTKAQMEPAASRSDLRVC